MMKTEIVFETSVSTKEEPHYPAENPKELLQENIFNCLATTMVSN
jgi:hypothetical protein